MEMHVKDLHGVWLMLGAKQMLAINKTVTQQCALLNFKCLS